MILETVVDLQRGETRGSVLSGLELQNDPPTGAEHLWCPRDVTKRRLRADTAGRLSIETLSIARALAHAARGRGSFEAKLSQDRAAFHGWKPHDGVRED
jgi:hypothetical protein